MNDPGALGIDLGSVGVKAAWLLDREALDPRAAWSRPALGRPLAALEALLDDAVRPAVGDEPLRLSLTGSAAPLLASLVPAGRVNEVVATALAVARLLPGTRTVIDVGGQLTKWIRLDGERVAEFALNGLCAAGSGAFLEQQAARLGVSVEQLGRLSCRAERGATVAGRCSVFAKSDMIHLQQKGTPVEEIAYGVCLALARTFATTILGGRVVEPPVVVVGGGAANPGLVRALREVLVLGPDDLVVPPSHATVGALGAALGAVAESPQTTLGELLRAVRSRGPSSIVARAAELAPLSPLSRPGPKPDEDPPRRDAGPLAVYLGVDVGSVSTNLVVLGPDGELLQGVYLPTRGRPVEVLDEALGAVRDKYGDELEILALGATGSGRHLAGRALGADTVRNEITAQMTSAASFFPDVDTVFEIGGQDSKYIGARRGRLASFEMNKICAAGTGSFLEEQAERLGVRIRGEFSDLALRARAPRDLGSRCTVFMDTELVRGLEQGVAIEDLCAGLAYSIARNYLDRVVAHRPVGDRVVFQGGTASNEAVAAALRVLTGKDVRVHPYNRVSGAIGAALLAAREHERTGAPSRFRGFEACRGASTRAFECSKCPNRCQVIRVAVGGLVAHFGDTCERYSERDGGPAAKPRTDLLAARAALLEACMPAPRPGRPRAVVPRASVGLEVAPFWGAVLDELGYDVVLSPPSTLDLVELGSAGLPAELCLPIKVAAGSVRRSLEHGPAVVVLPSVTEMPGRDPAGRCHTCLYTQEVPNLLRGLLGPRVIAPSCSLAAARRGLVEAEDAVAESFGVPSTRARRAVARGRAAQERFDRERVELGRRALAAGSGRPRALLLGRPYNLHDALLNLDLGRRLARVGLEAVPMDLLPLDEAVLSREQQRVQWRFSRDQLEALALAAEREDLFPVWVSSFGCGLDAFAGRHLEAMIGERPALVLEFDEHRGEAGLVTRLEAFADEVAEHVRHPPARRERSRPGPRRGLSGRLVVPRISDHAGVVAATLRAAGWDASVLPPSDETSVLLGEEHTSGRECHPFVVLAGDLVRWASSPEAGRGDAFYYPQSVTPCLISQYGDAHRAILRRLGADHVEVLALPATELTRFAGAEAALRMYEGITAVDLLMCATSALRPGAVEPAAVDRAYRGGLSRIEEAIASRRPAVGPLAEALAGMVALPRAGGDLARPVVGVCGDFYTRSNPTANADLFARLEAMGCQVWPHPHLGGLVDTASTRNRERWVRRGVLRLALFEHFVNCTAARRSAPLRDAVPAELRALCAGPSAEELCGLAAPYVGRGTSHLVVENVGKVVDFVRGGAHGVVSAVGIGCMVGVVVDGVLGRIRRDHPEVPMVTLAYGCSEGPSQRVRLETFVHQVHDLFARRREAPREEGGATLG